MISLKQVDTTNFWEVIDQSVAKEHENLVLNNAVSIAQAYVQPECIPLAIYKEDTLVGFAMYCIDTDDGEYWIYRFMIDQRFQGKGYGKLALESLINRIKEDKNKNKILLGVHLDGKAAVHLYQSMGFEFTGQVFGQEYIMELHY